MYILQRHYVQKKFIDYTIEEEEREGSKLAHTEFVFPIKSIKNCPQQDKNGVDCGIHVCHVMDRLCKGQEIEESLSPDELKAFKVEMFKNFTTEYFESRNL